MPEKLEVNSSDTVAAVVKACKLLRLFTAEQPVRSLGELAVESGLSKPTAHRLMASFVAAGLVAREPGGLYSIDLDLFTIGATALQRFDIRAAARPHLERLAREFGDTAFLMVPSRGGAVVIDRVEGSEPLRVAGITTGSVLPYHSAAAPVLMAAFDDEIQKKLIDGTLPMSRFTEHTIKTVAALKRRLAVVRDTGTCLSQEDHMHGVAAIAAPIRDARPIGNGLVATISLGGPTANFHGDQLIARTNRVREAADTLTALVHATELAV